MRFLGDKLALEACLLACSEPLKAYVGSPLYRQSQHLSTMVHGPPLSAHARYPWAPPLIEGGPGPALLGIRPDRVPKVAVGQGADTGAPTATAAAAAAAGAVGGNSGTKSAPAVPAAALVEGATGAMPAAAPAGVGEPGGDIGSKVLGEPGLIRTASRIAVCIHPC